MKNDLLELLAIMIYLFFENIYFSGKFEDSQGHFIVDLSNMYTDLNIIFNTPKLF